MSIQREVSIPKGKQEAAEITRLKLRAADVYGLANRSDRPRLAQNVELARQSLAKMGITDYTVTPQELADFKYFTVDVNSSLTLEDYEQQYLNQQSSFLAPSYNAYTGRTFDTVTGTIYDKQGNVVPGVTGGQERQFDKPSGDLSIQSVTTPTNNSQYILSGDVLTLPNGQKLAWSSLSAADQAAYQSQASRVGDTLPAPTSAPPVAKTVETLTLPAGTLNTTSVSDAFKKFLSRDATAEEIKYWSGQDSSKLASVLNITRSDILNRTPEQIAEADKLIGEGYVYIPNQAQLENLINTNKIKESDIYKVGTKMFYKPAGATGSTGATGDTSDSGDSRDTGDTGDTNNDTIVDVPDTSDDTTTPDTTTPSTTDNQNNNNNNNNNTTTTPQTTIDITQVPSTVTPEYTVNPPATPKKDLVNKKAANALREYIAGRDYGTEYQNLIDTMEKTKKRRLATDDVYDVDKSEYSSLLPSESGQGGPGEDELNSMAEGEVPEKPFTPPEQTMSPEAPEVENDEMEVEEPEPSTNITKKTPTIMSGDLSSSDEPLPPGIGSARVNYLFNMYLDRDATPEEANIYATMIDDTALIRDLKTLQDKESGAIKSEKEKFDSEWEDADIAEFVTNGDRFLVQFTNDPTPNDDSSDASTIFLYDKVGQNYIPFSSKTAIEAYFDTPFADIKELIIKAPIKLVKNPSWTGSFLTVSQGIGEDGIIKETGSKELPSMGAGGQGGCAEDGQGGAPIFKEGLNGAQKKSITDLVASGKVFNENDAKNYAYATNDYANWANYVNKTGTQILGTTTSDGSQTSDGSTDSGTAVVDIYGKERQDASVEKQAANLLGSVFTTLKKNGTISDAAFNSYIGNSANLSKYVSALLYGDYTLEDIYRDIKAKQLASEGNASYTGISGIDDNLTTDQFYATDSYKTLKNDTLLSVPEELGGMSSDLFKYKVFQIPNEAFSTIIAPIDVTSPEFKAEADKIAAAFYDITMQKAAAETDQAQAIADNNWAIFKKNLAKKYGLQLSDNTNAAWNQLQKLFTGSVDAGVRTSGIVSESMDRYLRDVRKGDELLRESKVEEEEIEQRSKLLNSGTPAEIQAFVSANPQKAREWGIVPSDDTKNYFSISNLKALYPDMDDDEIQLVRDMVLDENGNYRSSIYQKLYSNKYDTTTQKTAYQQEKLLAQKAKEEEKAYAPYTSAESPFSSYMPEYAKLSDTAKAELEAKNQTTPTPSTTVKPTPSIVPSADTVTIKDSVTGMNLSMTADAANRYLGQTGADGKPRWSKI
jgi:hypothetical protein